jgi:fucokinase
VAPNPEWDYLVLTASNALQARAYEAQMRLRRQAGLLRGVRQVMVAADPGGRRVGSGGATLLALEQILRLEGGSASTAETLLRRLRILIVHAGGDSMRLPAYGPCGKIFVPLPGRGDGPLPPALFDRLLPAFLQLPAPPPGQGQVVAAAGDALLLWDAAGLSLERQGITLLGAEASPQEASRHGVCCIGGEGAFSLYLQKPSLEQQQRSGAIRTNGASVLDIGVMSMDAAAAVALLRGFGSQPGQDDPFGLASQARCWAERGGLDLYREICCSLGSQASLDHYVRSARSSGSRWPSQELEGLFPLLHAIPACVQVLPRCRFLHFGSTRQLITSGLALVELDSGAAPSDTVLSINNTFGPAGLIRGKDCWVEGCRIHATLELSGRNVVVGVDLDASLQLPAAACLDILAGTSRGGSKVWFVRPYGLEDTFKDPASQGASFCGMPVLDWLAAVGLPPEDVWDAESIEAQRTLWNARVFPAESSPAAFRKWLWMYDPAGATDAQKQDYLRADRYSAAEIAWLADQEAWIRRRMENWSFRQSRSPDSAR